MTSPRRATILVACAYVWWGLSAIFWRELGSVVPSNQLSFRVCFGFFYLALVWFVRRRNPFRGVTQRHVVYGVGAAVTIGLNWVVFLWAVDNDQAVEAALGYFLMPLFAVALGVGLLGERPRPLQIAALVLATIGIIWTFVVLGTVPWVALTLGASFAIYGWARKSGPWNAVDGLTFETGLLAPAALLWLGSRAASGSNITGDGDLSTYILIVFTGVVTVVPLLLFAAAARRVSLTTVGLLQYINPTLQFLVGWQIFGESVARGRLLGFAWIWAALLLVVLDELRSKRPVDGGATKGKERLVRS